MRRDVSENTQENPSNRIALPAQKRFIAGSILLGVVSVLCVTLNAAIPRLAIALDNEPLIPSKGIEENNDDSARGLKLLENPRFLDTKENRHLNVGSAYPVENLEKVTLRRTEDGSISLGQIPQFTSRLGDNVVSTTERGDFVFYTLDANMQAGLEKLVSKATAPHVAVVVMNPKTGAILAIGGKSPVTSTPYLHTGFPAASLFKVVTAAAALETSNVLPTTQINFRGGNYTLGLSNYFPDPKRDTRRMTVEEALARSCNPVFGQLGLSFVKEKNLARYAKLFGFNTSLGLDLPLSPSRAQIPASDLYELSRTSAGFGEVRISPVHAATLMSAVASGGLLPRPYLLDKVVSKQGVVIEKTTPSILQRSISSATAETLLEMMQLTTTMGTSRKEFMRGSSHVLPGLSVAAKTGTLKGTNPVGLTNWFIAAAPAENPKIALAVVVVDPNHSMKASYVGRKVLENAFDITARYPDLVSSGPRRVTKTSARKISYSKRSIVSKTPKYSKIYYSKGKKVVAAKKVAPKKVVVSKKAAAVKKPKKR